MSDERAVQTVTTEAPAPSPQSRPLKRSPVHGMHTVAGATFVEANGWEVPASYGRPPAESEAIREGLAVCDISARAKVDLRGPIDEILGRLPKTEELVAARISSRWALLLSAPGTEERSLRAAETAAGDIGLATDATSIYAGFALCGPQTLDFLERITVFDARTIASGAAAGVQALKIPAILRHPGDPGFELYVASEYGRYAWESLLQLGAPLGIVPVGWDGLGAEGWR